MNVVDTYGRHAERPAVTAGLTRRDSQGGSIWLPWSIALGRERSGEGRHRATDGRPAGLYMERAGLVERVTFQRSHGGYLSAVRFLRHGEGLPPAALRARREGRQRSWERKQKWYTERDCSAE